MASSKLVVERHRLLRQAARILYRIPKARTTMRVLTRYLIQHAQLSITNKQRLYNFFAGDTAPDKPVTFSCAITNPDSATLNLELDIRDDLSSKWYYWGYTNYELGTVRLFAELLKTKRCIFDVGANIGFYTLLAACAIKDRGEVHAFEPHPEVFQWIAYNSDLNGFSALRLNQVALSDVDGEVPLFMPADSSAWTNASLVEGFMSQQDPIEINAVRFDTYCSKHLHVPVDLLKVDVEGAELKVFHGMGCLLDEWQPDIICEVLAPYENDLDVFFSDKPYRKFLITDDGLIEVERIKAHPQFRDFYLSVAPAELGRV